MWRLSAAGRCSECGELTVELFRTLLVSTVELGVLLTSTSTHVGIRGVTGCTSQRDRFS